MPKSPPGSDDDLPGRLAGLEGRLTGREERIVSEVRRDPGEAGRSTTAQIAGRADVDKSAVSRLAVKLGYSGFGAFREAAWRAGKASRDGDNGSASDHALLAQVQAELNAVSDAFAKGDLAALEKGLRHALPLVRTATRIVVAGVGAGPLMAQPVAMALKGTGKPVKTGGVSLTAPEQWHEPGDLLIVICVPVNGPPGRAPAVDLAELPEALGPVILWTTGTTPLKTRPRDLVLQVTGSIRLTTVAMGMTVFAKVVAETCREDMSGER